MLKYLTKRNINNKPRVTPMYNVENINGIECASNNIGDD